MMSALVPIDTFGADVLAHLDAQISSATALLRAVTTQAAAIRDNDIEVLLRELGEISAEMERRSSMEEARARLLITAGEKLGIPAHAVTLEHMLSLFPEESAHSARERSSRLRGLLDQIAVQHRTNRQLMRQEMQFADHLLRALGADPSAPSTYTSTGSMAGRYAPAHPQPVNLTTLDLEA